MYATRLAISSVRANLLDCAYCIEHFHGYIVEELHGGNIVRMVHEGSSKCRAAPLVLDLWIERDVVGGQGQRCAMAIERSCVSEFCFKPRLNSLPQLAPEKVPPRMAAAIGNPRVNERESIPPPP